jgi:SAM-dependent methyltransferase
MDPSTLNAYDTRASDFAGRYAAADVSPLHRLLLAHLPPGGRLLEIGCGAGRDAVFLAKHGFAVVAADASAAMLDQARNAPGAAFTAYPDSACSYTPVIQLLHAAFPLPAGHPLLADRFDAILALAVIMHLPDADLFEFACQVRQMLTPGGTLILSISEGRTLDPDSRDPHGRLFRERPPAELSLLFERLGFGLVTRDQTPDSLGRAEIRWTTLVLRLDTATGSRPVDQIETIINRDKKTATYKLALLRALCDIAQTASHQVRWHANETVSVPLGLVAERWLYAYWPLLEAGIRQIRGRGVAFGPSLLELAGEFRSVGGLDAFHSAYLRNQLNERQKAVLDETLNTIAATIITGPVTHAGGALDGVDPFFTHTGRQTARGRCFTSQALVNHLGRIHFRVEIWRELCLVGHWIGEAILLRWAELTHTFTGKSVSVATVLEKLLARPESKRDVALIRSLYAGFPALECVWTQQILKPTGTDGNSLVLDHVIPFSLWHNNELWNLLPAAKAVNSEKSDRMVTRAALRASEPAIIQCWQEIRRHETCRFDLEISRTLLGRNAPETHWERPAFNALIDAAEMVAIQRGVPRWEPSRKAAGAEVLGSAAPQAGGRTRPGRRKKHDLPNDASLVPSISTVREPRPDIPILIPTGRLPLVARLAAGLFFDGFATGGLADVEDLDWIAVPEKLCKPNRFVIRVAGDSMEPLFHIGDLLIFEYHRTPRQDNQIVIAADFTAGSATGEYAVKRYRAHPSLWRFLSEHPAYEPVEIPKAAMAYPILGTFVGRISE